MLLIKIHKSKTHLEKIYAVPLLFKGRYTFTSIFVYYYFFIFLFLTLQNKKYNGIRTFLPILATVSDYGKKNKYQYLFKQFFQAVIQFAIMCINPIKNQS